MNLDSKKNQTLQQVLLISILCIGLLFLVYMVAFRQSPLDADAQQKANGTKTAVALTAGPLLSPFPTSTAPTVTPSDTPTITSTIPTATSTATRTPTQTPTLIPTFTPRTIIPHATATRTLTPIPTHFSQPTSTTAPIVPTDTSIPPTEQPTDQPTEPPQPTDPPIIEIIKTILPPP